MKIVKFLDNQGNKQFGCDLADGKAEILAGELFSGFERTGIRKAVQKMLAPVTPPNIFGIGLNYKEHVRQMGADIPEYPIIFMKPTTAVVNPGEPILLPKCCINGPEVDYECELAVVIGKTARDVPEFDALSYVAGYTAANELSARIWAKVSRTRGKCFDSFCPLGPSLVTADEISDPQNLRLTTKLNNSVMQQGNTCDMIFSVAELISYLSQDTTLLPGTLILTGSPPGSGISRTPPVFLKSGDTIEVGIELIGTLSNPVSTRGTSLMNAA